MSSALTCWKDIAQYVGKGVRTVQRWERERGFPVRGDQRGAKRSVVAMPNEIDAWLQSRRLRGSSEFSDSVELARLRQLVETLQDENLRLQRELESERSGASTGLMSKSPC